MTREVFGWPVQLVVRWPVRAGSSATKAELVAAVAAEWPAFVAERGLWGTTEPRFRLDSADAVLVATGDVYAGPICLRSLREAL